jgi:hypothetical protein
MVRAQQENERYVSKAIYWSTCLQAALGAIKTQGSGICNRTLSPYPTVCDMKYGRNHVKPHIPTVNVRNGL